MTVPTTRAPERDQAASATIAILGFDPMQLELPAATTFTGSVRVRLPAVRLKLIDLSLGGLVPDAPCIATEAPVTDVVIAFDGILKLGEVVDIIAAAAGKFQEIWRASQCHLDSYGPLLK